MFVDWLLSGQGQGPTGSSTLAVAFTYGLIALPGGVVAMCGSLLGAVLVTIAWYGVLLGIATIMNAVLGL
jgi:hypothetical protein